MRRDVERAAGIAANRVRVLRDPYTSKGNTLFYAREARGGRRGGLERRHGRGRAAAA